MAQKKLVPKKKAATKRTKPKPRAATETIGLIVPVRIGSAKAKEVLLEWERKARNAESFTVVGQLRLPDAHNPRYEMRVGFVTGTNDKITRILRYIRKAIGVTSFDQTYVSHD